MRGLTSSEIHSRPVLECFIWFLGDGAVKGTCVLVPPAPQKPIRGIAATQITPGVNATNACKAALKGKDRKQNNTIKWPSMDFLLFWWNLLIIISHVHLSPVPPSTAPIEMGTYAKFLIQLIPAPSLKTSCYYIKAILLQDIKFAWLEGIIIPGFVSSLFHLLSAHLSARKMLLSRSLWNTKGYQPQSQQPTPFPNRAGNTPPPSCLI